MKLDYDMIDAYPEEALEYMKQKLNGYRRYWDRVYVGVTSSPEHRAARHERNGWKKMVVLYEAFEPDDAAALERELIAYAHKCNFLIPIENVNPGGESIRSARRSNFLYVLVGN